MTTQEIESAIERSKSHTEIAHIEVPGDDVETVRAYLESLATHEGLEHDDVRDGDTIKVWAFDPDAPEGSMMWRVHLDVV